MEKGWGGYEGETQVLLAFPGALCGQTGTGGPGLGTALLTSRQPPWHCRTGHRWSRERLSVRPEGIASVLTGSDSPGIRPDWFSGADQTNNIVFISFWP